MNKFLYMAYNFDSCAYGEISIKHAKYAEMIGFTIRNNHMIIATFSKYHENAPAYTHLPLHAFFSHFAQLSSFDDLTN